MNMPLEIRCCCSGSKITAMLLPPLGPLLIACGLWLARRRGGRAQARLARGGADGRLQHSRESTDLLLDRLETATVGAGPAREHPGDRHPRRRATSQRARIRRRHGKSS